MKNKIKNYNCPVGTTLDLIGGKYKVVIIWYLSENGVLRYNELQKLLLGVTPKMLISQLRELEEDKLIKRKVYPVVPPKVEYSLTELGKSLIPILQEMKTWGEKYENA
ncbi:TPA: transcriptional regulator [Candidatus Gastranaerophilales bacterium HUM_6]|nr:site-specific recombinase phage integrase family [Fusobacterium sp. CAG:815]DAA92246.1 MAG TPA: transcriptional regulator [Candidatus Gastranaerophilales bacterium HUM_6]DAA93458.1 MAG TPA: transcriptional regulator [Candidatus Gastranaerophilales bacterium HUM_7]DAB01610.1 MAG TPA: transcriptional regulator [Candidatus Gastranaerophilales bacterium HUM_12]DAB08758.1 MAG TPA: transcriptional regulator [Candidatus Gastranaerophilales bacterium HUM_14]